VKKLQFLHIEKTTFSLFATLICKKLVIMAILGSIVKRTVIWSSYLKKSKSLKPVQKQGRVLLKLLKKAKKTEFGLHYNFKTLIGRGAIKVDENIYPRFKTSVPLHDYNSLYASWWRKVWEGQENVTWPGKVKYFALSSGTSEASSKTIPVTKAMIKAMHKASVAQIITLGHFKNLPKETFEKGYLLLGGSTKLNDVNGHLEGDLSGITVSQIPFWFERFFKPGQRISQEKSWEMKLQEITAQAASWDVAFVAGVPAWIQILFERIIKHYQVENIHQIWPNLVAFGWGGVSLDPYRESFAQLLDNQKPFYYLETYLASEGFIAYQSRPDGPLQLVLNNGIFYEFIPFTTSNFDDEGNLKANPHTLMIGHVEENKEYALVISTCAGAWRYLIGDTIRFLNAKKAEILITGRTKHFLNLCGEHLTVENMNTALMEVAMQLNLALKEFTILGKREEHHFVHQWYIGCDSAVDERQLAMAIDHKLKNINDDYATERAHALGEIRCRILPNKVFLDWMKQKGKEGGQHKFPRVLRGETANSWENYVSD
jgi:GH3 auxin-responsive promoter